MNHDTCCTKKIMNQWISFCKFIFHYSTSSTTFCIRHIIHIAKNHLTFTCMKRHQNAYKASAKEKELRRCENVWSPANHNNKYYILLTKGKIYQWTRIDDSLPATSYSNMMSVTAYWVYRMIKEHAIDLKHIIKKAICILQVLLYITISSLHLKLK